MDEAANGEALASQDANDAAQDEDPDEVALVAVSALPRDMVLAEGLGIFTDELAQVAPWVSVDLRGGPEVIPQDQLAEAVADGSVDLALIPPSAYVEAMPIAAAMKLSTQSPLEERSSGVYEFLHRRHVEQGNVHYLGKVLANTPYRLYVNEPVEERDGRLDLSGLTIRVSPVYVEIVEALGGEPVRIPTADIYTSLERGVVDGYGWPVLGIADLGLDDVTRYEIDIDFYDGPLSLLLNLDTWEALDERTRDAITEAIIRTEEKVFDHFAERVAEEAQARRAAGIDLLTYSPAASQDFVDTATDLGWADAIAKDSEAESLRALLGE